MRILLVDDDEGVVQALKAVLKSLAVHQVRTAGTGEEALAIAAEWEGVDLLITDVVMEPMDGFTLRDHLFAQYPAMRTIQISGYDLSDYPAQIEPFQFLAKPVDAEDLRKAVAREFPAEEAEAVVEEAEVVEEERTPEFIAPPEGIREPEPEPELEVAPEPEPEPVIAEAKAEPVSLPEPEVAPVPIVEPEPVPAAIEESKPEFVAPPEPIQEPEPEPVIAEAETAPVIAPRIEPELAPDAVEETKPEFVAPPEPIKVPEPEPEPKPELVIAEEKAEPVSPPKPVVTESKAEPVSTTETLSAPAFVEPLPLIPLPKSEPFAPPGPAPAAEPEAEKSEPEPVIPPEPPVAPMPVAESKAISEPEKSEPEPVSLPQPAAPPEPAAPSKSFDTTTFPRPSPVSAPKIPPSEPASPALTPVVPPAVRPVTVRATAVPSPTAKTPPPTAVPAPTAKTPPSTAGARPGAVATPKAGGPSQPTPTVRATAIPRPSGVTPVAPAPTIPPPTATPMAAPVTPAKGPPGGGSPTVRVATTSKIQPVPQPKVAGARPPTTTAAPVATPTARPKATAAPATPVKAPAAPTPTARAGATPAKVTAPAAEPKVTAPTSQPKAAAQASASAVAAPSAAPSSLAPPPTFPAPPAPASSEDLSGQTFGAYQILRKLGHGRWGNIYAGMQTSINRPVALEILDSDKAADPVSQARFVADARAKAAVQHPSILAVYEAGETDDRFFYAYEHVDGESIAEMKLAGRKLDEVTAMKVLRVAADGLSYLNTHHTPHVPPDPATVFLGSDGQPRLANLATQLSDEQLAPQQEIQALGRAMLGVLPAIQSLSPGLREMLKRMVQPGAQALHSWSNLLQGIKTIEPKNIPTDAAKISAQDRAAIAAVEQARKQQKRTLYYNLASVGSLLILVGITVWFFVLRNKQRIYDEQIQIPAGPFLFANGESKTLPDFWIDKYEVTYGQYARFVKALENRPTTEFDHPQQPRIKNSAMHKPPHWDIYYGQAAAGGKARSIPIDLSCPVMEVDFWDAYAYAKWKKRELPTEEEWEKAARGAKGFIYPWGDEFGPAKVNSNADFNAEEPAQVGKVDGYNFWNPVDKITGDKSPYGIIGMAGNVREWTATWDQVKKRPISKGGSFMSSDARLDQRTDLDPNAISESLGFRTVTRTSPTK